MKVLSGLEFEANGSLHRKSITLEQAIHLDMNACFTSPYVVLVLYEES